MGENIGADSRPLGLMALVLEDRSYRCLGNGKDRNSMR